MKIIEKYLQKIQEAKRRSISTISRQAKISRATGAMAASVARQKNDPLYKKMIFHKNMWKKYKEQVMKKYSNRVKQKARQ